MSFDEASCRAVSVVKTSQLREESACRRDFGQSRRHHTQIQRAASTLPVIAFGSDG